MPIEVRYEPDLAVLAQVAATIGAQEQAEKQQRLDMQYEMAMAPLQASAARQERGIEARGELQRERLGAQAERQEDRQEWQEGQYDARSARQIERANHALSVMEADPRLSPADRAQARRQILAQAYGAGRLPVPRPQPISAQQAAQSRVLYDPESGGWITTQPDGTVQVVPQRGQRGAGKAKPEAQPIDPLAPPTMSDKDFASLYAEGMKAYGDIKIKEGQAPPPQREWVRGYIRDMLSARQEVAAEMEQQRVTLPVRRAISDADSARQALFAELGRDAPDAKEIARQYGRLRSGVEALREGGVPPGVSSEEAERMRRDIETLQGDEKGLRERIRVIGTEARRQVVMPQLERMAQGATTRREAAAERLNMAMRERNVMRRRVEEALRAGDEPDDYVGGLVESLSRTEENVEDARKALGVTSEEEVAVRQAWTQQGQAFGPPPEPRIVPKSAWLARMRETFGALPELPTAPAAPTGPKRPERPEAEAPEEHPEARKQLAAIEARRSELASLSRQMQSIGMGPGSAPALRKLVEVGARKRDELAEAQKAYESTLKTIRAAARSTSVLQQKEKVMRRAEELARTRRAQVRPEPKQ